MMIVSNAGTHQLQFIFDPKTLFWNMVPDKIYNMG